jgi:acid phosphatase
MSSLGERIREVYINKYVILVFSAIIMLMTIVRLQFLPDVYDEESIYLRSSDYNRTQESVQQLVAGGLYPENKRPKGSILKLRIR